MILGILNASLAALNIWMYTAGGSGFNLAVGVFAGLVSIACFITND